MITIFGFVGRGELQQSPIATAAAQTAPHFLESFMLTQIVTKRELEVNADGIPGCLRPNPTTFKIQG